jgi:predicted MFS family arabinose efflux permease
MFGVGWGANQFVSLLVAYHLSRGLSVGTDQALFGIYALGLMPALLIAGPASDRWGRARIVRPMAVSSVVATLVLIAGDHSLVALYIGRFLAGVASGAVFAAGTAWVKELSSPPYEAAGEQAGARRAAISLSAGFGLGPVATGVIGQWVPDPFVTAYLPHLLVMAVAIPWLWRCVETVQAPGGGASLVSRLRVPAARQARFVRVVLPLAPWVFGSPSVAFAVLPTLVSARTHGHGVIFAGAMAGLTLALGVGIQPLARRLDRVDDARGAAVGLLAVTAGLVLAAVTAHTLDPVVAVVAAAVLGVGYGLGLVSGLLEVQRLAAPAELAGLSAVFYVLTYVGFAIPVALAHLSGVASYPAMLAGLAVLSLLCCVIVRTQAPRHPGFAAEPNG